MAVNKLFERWLPLIEKRLETISRDKKENMKTRAMPPLTVCFQAASVSGRFLCWSFTWFAAAGKISQPLRRR